MLRLKYDAQLRLRILDFFYGPFFQLFDFWAVQRFFPLLRGECLNLNEGEMQQEEISDQIKHMDG